MHRIVDGILFEGKRLEDAWDVSVWESNGHRELSARAVVEWRELGPVPVLDWSSRPLGELDPVADADLIEEKRQRALKKAAQRAQTACRRVIKAEGFNELLTITYRENQQDRELCKQHFKEWVRRMKAALGGTFRYCASFEKQARGAMHVHVACHKLPKHARRNGMKVHGWRLGTEIWRSIVGKDNGLVFVGGKPKQKGGKRLTRSPAKMAQYVSKYIMKDFADAPEESNRYSRSNGVDLGTVQRMRLCGVSMADLISVAFECKDGDVIVSHRLGDFKDTYWLCTEPETVQNSS
ncbi:MAG TPA: hypothetical protein VFE82_09125 [Ramlibacter sp.]|jgi:hypothetical protein|uniref:rolling circle replication-associated protein n=1 Tax=Ramlibacter sp. TaxID=1917967 RepID=UPI002D4D094D|nr:hypothetical protein [Ramlibacter sp.]HZY18632.1 hypothetical protein [Ramlibacter sp.]